MASWDNNKKILKFENLLEQYYKVEQEMEDLIEEYNNSCNKLIYKELWKGIEGHPNHVVSTYGRVKNIKTGHILKPQTQNKGYLVVNFRINGKMKHKLLHRIVAHAFILNPHVKPFVDHIDNCRTNNNIENLRYSSCSENGRNRTKTKTNNGFKGSYWIDKMNKYRAQIKIDGKTVYLGMYETAEEASKVYEAKAKEVFKEFYKPPITNV